MLRNLPYFRLFVLLNFGSKRGTETVIMLLLACKAIPRGVVMPSEAHNVTQASRASLYIWKGR